MDFASIAQMAGIIVLVVLIFGAFVCWLVIKGISIDADREERELNGDNWMGVRNDQEAP